jgi:hypothetical protein
MVVINYENRDGEVILNALPVDDEDITDGQSCGIKVVPFGLESRGSIPNPLTSNRLWMQIYTPRPFPSKSLRATLKYLQSDEPIVIHLPLSLPPLQTNPSNPSFLDQGTSMFEAVISVLSRDHQDQFFVIQIDPVGDEPDIAPFYSHPFRVMPKDFQTNHPRCFCEHVFPILQEIYAAVMNKN